MRNKSKHYATPKPTKQRTQRDNGYYTVKAKGGKSSSLFDPTKQVTDYDFSTHWHCTNHYTITPYA